MVEIRFWYHILCSATDLESALQFESEHAAKVLTTEAIMGAKKFLAGYGRSGKFNVNSVSLMFDLVSLSLIFDLVSLMIIQ